MQQWEVRVNPDRAEGLREGDELTFFYPSTEMAVWRSRLSVFVRLRSV